MAPPDPNARSALLTLADCYCGHVDVIAICEVEAHRCYRSAVLDLVALMLKHGDLSLDALRERLVCKLCRRRSFRLQVIHKQTPDGRLARRDLPPEVRKKILADKVARACAAIDDIRADIRNSKPIRL
jgi:hypothetical protein